MSTTSELAFALSILQILNWLCEDLFAELSQSVSLKATEMHIPLRRRFKKLPIIALGCLLRSLFKIQLAGECPIVITANCDNPLLGRSGGECILEVGGRITSIFHRGLQNVWHNDFCF